MFKPCKDINLMSLASFNYRIENSACFGTFIIAMEKQVLRPITNGLIERSE
jgi:hypothetical protein